MKKLLIKRLIKRIGKYDEETNTLYPDVNKLITFNRKTIKRFNIDGTISIPNQFIDLTISKDKPLNIILENQIFPRLYTNDHRPVLFNAYGNIIFKNCNIDPEHFYVSDYYSNESNTKKYDSYRYIKFKNCNFTGEEIVIGNHFNKIAFSNNKYIGENDKFSFSLESKEYITFKNENISNDREIKFNITSSKNPLKFNIENSSFNLDSISDLNKNLPKKYQNKIGLEEINIKNSTISGVATNLSAYQVNINNSHINEKYCGIYSNQTDITNSTLLVDSIDLNSNLFIETKNSFIKSNNLKIKSNNERFSKLSMNVSAINSDNCDIDVNKLFLVHSSITGNNTILKFNNVLFDNDSKIKSNDLLLDANDYPIDNIKPGDIEANIIYANDKNNNISLLEPRNNFVNVLKNITEKVNNEQEKDITATKSKNKVKNLIKK